VNADAPRPQDALRVNPATAGKGVSRLVDDGILYTKRFGSFTAVDNVTFSLEQNKIHGLLGRNGAGKTTIMQMLTGQQFSTAGTVAVFGKNPVENAQVLQRVCFIAESQRYPETFKVKHVLASAPWFGRKVLHREIMHGLTSVTVADRSPQASRSRSATASPGATSTSAPRSSLC
jgi:ABC-type branched-subunit amino acid transport system ATPase component